MTGHRRLERAGYIAGALFPFAMFGGIMLAESGRTWIDPQDGEVAPGVLREWFTVDAINRIGFVLTLAATAMLLAFALALYTRFVRTREASRTTALAALVGAAGFTYLAASTSGVELVSQYDAGAVDPAVLLAWFAAGEIAFGALLGAFFALAGFLGAISVAGIVHRTVPRWIAWSAGVLAVTMTVGVLAAPITWDVGFVAWLSFLGFMIWTVAVAIRMLLRPDEAAAPSLSTPTIDSAAAAGI